MGLEPADIRMLLRLRKEYPRGKSCLILGDCLFHFTRSDLAEWSGGQRMMSSDRATLADVAGALGFDRLETVDLFGQPTIRQNLQADALPDRWGRQFDWVIDAGTLYCCFNVSKVFENVLLLLKPEGAVLHLASLAGHFGRGYYSLSPMLFRDFYQQNGFEIIEMGVRVKPRQVDSRCGVIRGLAGRIASRLGVEIAPPVLYEWQRIGAKDLFLASAGATDLQFTTTYQPSEPDVLPNNALIMCFARRERAVPFADAIPGYFAR